MVVGFLLATLIGLSLGLMGGGGSILTVPILVYVLKMDPKLSIALSLAIVGTTALIGSISHYKAGNVNLKIVGFFAPFAMIGVYGGAYISKFLSGSTQLIIFAIIMLIASVFMFKGRQDLDNKEVDDKKSLPIFLIGIQGIIVGIITGIVGVGGGFMIVPALVLLAKTPMKQAVGTSLLIIALNSFTGFIGYMQTGIIVPWMFLGKFIIFTAIGIIVGSKLIKFVSQEKLKKVFAIFLIIMGILILYKNKDKLNISSNQSDKIIIVIKKNIFFSFKA